MKINERINETISTLFTRIVRDRPRKNYHFIESILNDEQSTEEKNTEFRPQMHPMNN